MNELRKGLPPIPTRMLHLPINDKGYPVPYFVAWVDGKPDFRIMDGDKLQSAIKFRRCWLCGQPLGKYMTFTIGPMCAINRTIAEPPSHIECARFAVRACPFLTLPNAKRREAGLEIDGVNIKEPAGHGLKRNPGVALLWTTLSCTIFPANGGILFRLGEPESLSWWAEGRTASRAEILESINSGLPLLRKVAEDEGPDAIVAFEQYVERGMRLVPVA